ncbi:MAG: phytanoyl-CoA dioxygenase family protein, partial [Acidimicrobiales bacterium]
YAPSEVDIEQFRSRGYFVAPGLFSPKECERALAHIEQAAFELALGNATEGPLSYRPMMHLGSPELTALATDARWAAIVLPLLGTGDARLYWEQAVAKPPQARTELPWHQDNGYTPLVPEEYVTCWWALDDATEDNGCLWLIPTSHRHGTQPHENGGSGPFRVGHSGPAEDGVAVPVRHGSVLVFSSLMMHRSGPNVTDAPRRAWIIQFCPADARSALSGRLLDDRLLVASEGRWLDLPVRQREFDLAAVLANYDQR